MLVAADMTYAKGPCERQAGVVSIIEICYCNNNCFGSSQDDHMGQAVPNMSMST